MTPVDALLAEAAELRARADALEAKARFIQAEEHDCAIVEALRLYSGSDRKRAVDLEAELLSYASNGWLRESYLEELSDSRPARRRALHRILRARQGRTIGERQIRNIAKVGNRARMTFPTPQCDSRFEADERQTHERV